MTTLNTGAGMAMVAFALSRGLTMAEIQSTIGITCSDLLKPHVRPPEDMMPKLWVLLGDRFPDEPITLDMARAAPFSFFGGLADGVQFADDLRTAIELFVKNSAIIAGQLKLYFCEKPSEASLTSHHPLDSFDGGRSAESGAALAARLFTEFLGVSDCIQRVTMSHGPHSDVEHYADYFTVPVEFNAPETGLVFKPEKLSTKIKYANVELFNYVEAHFSHVQKQIIIPEEPRELTLLRKAAAENALHGTFSTANVAITANMSLRAAQRLAAMHGTTVQELIDNVRESRAKEFLRDDHMDISSIALLLGYSDDRAFRRAFQRWAGLSPTEYRNALKNVGN